MTRIAAGQADFHVGDSAYNLRQIDWLLSEAAGKGVEILVLPELANSGYVFSDAEEVKRAAEPIPFGPACRLLADWSREGRLVACGLCEAEGTQLYNSTAVFADGEHRATYRKAHLFMNEPDFFTPGDQEPPVVTWQGYRIGVMICFDWAFPEMGRVLALQGAQVILHPSNLVLPYGQQAMCVRSIENRVFTVTANRFGSERGVTFSGLSQVTSINGDLLAQAPANEPGVWYADVDLTQADTKQITPRNHLFNDRRPELYRRLQS